jgi:hypothetical protein
MANELTATIGIDVPECSPSPIPSTSLRFSARPAGRRRASRRLDIDLDIAAGRGLEEAVVQSNEIGAVNSWLGNQPAQVISAAVASLREALAPYADGLSVRLRGAMWLISSVPA